MSPLETLPSQGFHTLTSAAPVRPCTYCTTKTIGFRYSLRRNLNLRMRSARIFLLELLHFSLDFHILRAVVLMTASDLWSPVLISSGLYSHRHGAATCCTTVHKSNFCPNPQPLFLRPATEGYLIFNRPNSII